MTIQFVAEALTEFAEASEYYEHVRPGLGVRFREEIDAHLRKAIDHPGRYPLRAGGYRRINLRVFPYHITYLEMEDVLWVFAVAHNRRRPLYWLSRRRRFA